MPQDATPPAPAGSPDSSAGVNPTVLRTPSGGPVETALAAAPAVPPPSPSTAPAPPSIGAYEILGELGSGAMGVVYLARQRDLNRTVALKVLRARGPADAEGVQRFHREAQAAARLHHPGIVAIHDVGQDGDLHYYSMDYIIGETVDDLARRGRPTPRRALELIHEVALALAYAHAEGVVHRDLKPQNLLLTGDGRVLITDFGLAKDLSRESLLTLEGTLLGTPAYMPPEQALGRLEQVDARSDVYSLGAVLYTLLTGRPPFVGPTPRVLHDVVHTLPEAPRRLHADVSADVETLCLKCLEKDPARRYPSAEALADDTLRFLEGLPIAARPPSFLGRVARVARRKLPLTAAVGALVLTVSAGVLYYSVLEVEHAAKLDREARRLDTLHGRYREVLHEWNACGTEPIDTWAARAARLREELDRIVAEAPDLWDARQTRAVVAEALGDLGTAGQDLDILVARDPDTDRTLYRIQAYADRLLERGYARECEDRVAAGREAARRLSARPAHGFALASRVRASLRAGDAEGALVAARALLAEQEARPEVLYVYVRALLLAGVPDLREALDTSERLLLGSPRGAAAFSVRAEVLLAAGKAEEAAEALDVALRLQLHPAARDIRMLGEAGFRLRCWHGQDPTTRLATWAERLPDEASLWAHLASAHRAAGRVREAEAALARAWAAGPEDPATLAEAVAAGRGTDPDLTARACAALVRPVDREGTSPEAGAERIRLADALADAGRAGEAAEAVARASSERREDGLLALIGGRLALRLGRSDEAAAFLGRAIASRPRDGEAWFASGILHARAGRVDEAERCLAAAARLDQARPEPAVALGFVMIAAGREGPAVEAFTEAARRYAPPALGERWEAWQRGEHGLPLAPVEEAGPVGTRVAACAPAVAHRLIEESVAALAGKDPGPARARAAAAALVHPDSPQAWLALARAHERCGQIVEAGLCLRQAVKHGVELRLLEPEPRLRRLLPRPENR